MIYLANWNFRIAKIIKMVPGQQYGLEPFFFFVSGLFKAIFKSTGFRNSSRSTSLTWGCFLFVVSTIKNAGRTLYKFTLRPDWEIKNERKIQ